MANLHQSRVTTPLLVLGMLVLNGGLYAQPGPPPDGPINGNTRKQVMDSVAARLRRGYVFPMVAQRVNDSVAYYAKTGRYDRLNTGMAFAEALTKDVQRIAKDSHLRIEYTNPVDLNRLQPGDSPTNAERLKRMQFNRAVNHGIDQVSRLAGNVGLLALRVFANPDEAAQKITAALTLLADTEALIIDLRYNAGGNPALVSYLASYFFEGQPRLLTTLAWRSAAGNQPTRVTDQVTGAGLIEQSWTQAYVHGPKYIDKPLYILVSSMTASGGEELAYIMQTQKRGLIVGEKTAGAANPGGSEQITPNFEMFIARGRAINPITKTSWESSGVKPDVAIAAELGLTKAYALALRAIERRGNYAGPEPLAILAAEEEIKLGTVGK